jgi:hypothetical protein
MNRAPCPQTGYIALIEDEKSQRQEASAFLLANEWKEYCDTNWTTYSKENDLMSLNVTWHNRTVDGGSVIFLDKCPSGQEYEIPLHEEYNIMARAKVAHGIWQALNRDK